MWKIILKECMIVMLLPMSNNISKPIQLMFNNLLVHMYKQLHLLKFLGEMPLRHIWWRRVSLTEKMSLKHTWQKKNIDADDKFEILSWWKQNSSRFPIMLCMLRVMFATLVSMVALESAFSTGGRIWTHSKAPLI